MLLRRLVLLACLSTSGLFTGLAFAQEFEKPTSSVIYFASDSAIINAEFKLLIKKHARYLATQPNIKIRIEGHTDKHGSRRYNLALGERRAQAVKAILVEYGVQSDQFESVSFGEEIRIDNGLSNTADTNNRRVTLIYP